MPIFMRLPMRVQRYHHWIRGDGGGCRRSGSKLLWRASRLAPPVLGGPGGAAGRSIEKVVSPCSVSSASDRTLVGLDPDSTRPEKTPRSAGRFALEVPP